MNHARKQSGWPRTLLIEHKRPLAWRIRVGAMPMHEPPPYRSSGTPPSTAQLKP